MTAKFLRRGWERYSKMGRRRKKKQVWRRPHGRDNKMREKRAGYGPVVSIGYRTQKDVRGKIDNKKVVMIININDLNRVKSSEIAILGKIGKKKRMEIAKKAKEKNIQIHNLNIDKFLKKYGEKEKMKLDKKKALAAKVLGVGKQRIIFIEPRLNEIKEAITKEDIRNLKADGAIIIKEARGKRSRQKKRQIKRSPGNIRKNAKNSKREYMIITRKLRKHISELKSKHLLARENELDLRKKIKNRFFKNKNQLKEYLQEIKK